jgi:hypothetical protein
LGFQEGPLFVDWVGFLDWVGFHMQFNILEVYGIVFMLTNFSLVHTINAQYFLCLTWQVHLPAAVTSPSTLIKLRVTDQALLQIYRMIVTKLQTFVTNYGQSLNRLQNCEKGGDTRGVVEVS